MRPAAGPLSGETLDDFVENYEAAQERDGWADVACFLPEPGHPLYLEVLRELVRVDLEYSWRQGRPKRLEEYQTQFPELFRHPPSLQEITFEEYRLRQQAGENPALAEYQQRFGVAGELGWVDPAEQLAELSGLSPAAPLVPGPKAEAQPTPVRELSADEELRKAARAYREFRRQGSSASSAALDAWFLSQSGGAGPSHVFRDLYRQDPAVADRLAEVATQLPALGTEFLGFHLIGELGRGAFGRVYLARQGDLAQRLVALKLSAELFGESQTLAQLQHTNIVPIYSLHRADPFQAVCMPFFGATTLADVLKEIRGRTVLPDTGKGLVSTLASRRQLQARMAGDGSRVDDPSRPQPPHPSQPNDVPALLKMLQGFSYPEAVLWIAARLAEGLAHAHERGILHRDLKPGNVLLTDDGQPMLLDFNLSQDTKLRGQASVALIGGTLPYMAPAQLEAFRGGKSTADTRDDLYSLGVMLYELLTGRMPFEARRGEPPAMLDQMLADRRRLPPSPRRWNRGVTPAVAAIVLHCLEPAPARRYGSARELGEDLQRQLQHQPLKHVREPSLRERARKWRRRHPRLTSAASVAVALGAVLLGLASLLAYNGRRLARFEALAALPAFREELRGAHFQLVQQRQGDRLPDDDLGRRLLERYQVQDNPGWRNQPAIRNLPEEEQRRLREDLGELLLLRARVQLGRLSPDTGPVQKREWLRAALQLNQSAEGCYLEDQIPRALWLQRAELAAGLGQTVEAEHWRRRAEQTPLGTARQISLFAGELAARGQFREALPWLRQARDLDPRDFWTWFDLGLCYEQVGRDADAVACYSSCSALAPQFAPVYFQRGGAQLRLRHFEDARADLSQALRLQPDWVAAHINRALAFLGVKHYAEAERDLAEALRLDATYPLTYFIRARVREQAGDGAAARRDLDEGLRRQPTDERTWVARGQAHLARDPRAALADFDQALCLNPRSRAAMQYKAYTLSEKLDRTREAVQVLDRALALFPQDAPALAGRGVLLARLGRRADAHRDAEASLRADSRPETLYRAANCYALTSRTNAEDAPRALQLLGAALRKGFGFELLDTDRDLDPIRKHPEFRPLEEAARAFSPAKTSP